MPEVRGSVRGLAPAPRRPIYNPFFTMVLSLRTLRFRLQAMGLLLVALQRLFGLLQLSWGQALSGWVSVLSFLVIILLGLLAFRWLKAKLLWRLRNRLIVTYVFIGVIPVVLVMTMASITIYLFA